MAIDTTIIGGTNIATTFPASQVPDQGGTQAFNGFYVLAAWAIFIIVLVLIARSKIGYTILFFFAIASMLVVLALGSPTIVAIFSNATMATTQGNNNG